MNLPSIRGFVPSVFLASENSLSLLAMDDIPGERERERERGDWYCKQKLLN